MANKKNREFDSQTQEFPQLQLEQGKGWGGRFSDWLKRNSSLIVATVIIIVLAGGIYVYTKQSQNQPFLLDEKNELEDITLINDQALGDLDEINQEIQDLELDEVTIDLDDANEDDLSQIDIEAEGISGSDIAINTNNTTDEESANESDEFQEIARKGEGITHLARRALKKYLESRVADFELKPEHKIYIEDYLKDKTGSELLEIGEGRSFSKSLIDEAIEKAGNLSEKQINNITPYAQAVSF